jgi:hypothetical protein
MMFFHTGSKPVATVPSTVILANSHLALRIDLQDEKKNGDEKEKVVTTVT